MRRRWRQRAVALIAAVFGVVSTPAFGETVAPPPAGFEVQSVNTPGQAATACACALKGVYGGCIEARGILQLRAAARDARVELPACRAQLAAKGDEVMHLRTAITRLEDTAKGLSGSLAARASALQAAESAAGATGAIAAAVASGRPVSSPLAAPVERPSRVGWALLGVVAGVALTLGAVYLVAPAIRAAQVR